MPNNDEYVKKSEIRDAIDRWILFLEAFQKRNRIFADYSQIAAALEATKKRFEVCDSEPDSENLREAEEGVEE